MTVINELGEFVDTSPPHPMERFVNKPNDARFNTRPCDWCGKRFTPVRSAQKFCCDECRQARHVDYYTKYNERRSEKRRKKRERKKVMQ